MSKRLRAFSLIELSIVIVIVGILIGGVLLSMSLAGKTQTTVNTYIENNIPEEDRRSSNISSGSSSLFTGSGFTTSNDPSGKTIVTFDSAGTFNISTTINKTVEILVVGGGGGGGVV